MAVRSKIENHPERPAIERGLARRVPLRKLGKRFGVSIDALFRHKRKLLREAPELFTAMQAADWKVSPEELEALRVEIGDGWLRNVHAELCKVMHYRDVCIADDNHADAARWEGHIQKFFDMLGHAVDQLKAHTVNIQNNFYNSPDYWLIQRAILEALAGHPQARADVLRALESIGDGSTPPMITVSPSQVAA